MPSSHNNTFWAHDWFVALILVTLFAAVSHSRPIQELDLLVYDWVMRTMAPKKNRDIAIIAIDDKSIDQLGRWPWSRNIHASMLDQLSTVKSKAVVYTTFFSEPEKAPGLTNLESLQKTLKELGVNPEFSEEDGLWDGFENEVSGIPREKMSALKTIQNRVNRKFQELSVKIDESIGQLDTDSLMVKSAGDLETLLLPMLFSVSEPTGQKMPPLPQYTAHSVASIRIRGSADSFYPLTAVEAITPISVLGEVSSGVGHLNIFPDIDGVVRKDTLIINYFGSYFPSLSLLTVARSLGNDAADIHIIPGRGVEINGMLIETTPQMQTFPIFSQSGESFGGFPTYSFVDVLNGRIPLSNFAGKIVLVGVSAKGVGSKLVTPMSASTPPVSVLAYSIASILQVDAVVSPLWTMFVTIGLSLLIAIMLVLIFPKLKARFSAGLFFVTLTAILFLEYYALAYLKFWIPLAFPSLMLTISYWVLIIKKFVITERGLRNAKEDSDENNRVLALTYQSQGQLDLAFDKFKKCSKTLELASALYSLGLDFERKRQTHKAVLVYEYIQSIDRDFKGIDQRIRAAGAHDMLINPLDTARREDPTLVDDGTLIELEKPTLGRYQITKELGRGGMGAVYLGIDPKINRTVAIKTLDLHDQISDSEFKQRFFREAEAIGRLNHPNIVTIYDVGEERDLAYIAMELLDGKELSVFTKKNMLLPVDVVINIGIKCAEALDFAHAKNIVHRDIKPSNIMFSPDTQSVKITDFGVAYIMHKNVTETGMVIGTLSFMSPEQIRGEKLDGRSDIFSLGVTLYLLLSGAKPFPSDSLETASYNIVHTEEKRLHEANLNIDLKLSEIISQSMRKLPEDRFQSGAQMKIALQNCLEYIEQERCLI